MIILHMMRVDVSIVCLCVMFARGVAKLNVVKRDYFTTKYGRISPSSTTLIQQKVPSLSVCVSLCSIHKACCVASYDRKTQQCNLDKSCCPESEQSADAQMLKIRTDSLACPNGWLKNGNKCYYFSDKLNTWTDAKIACETEKGMLVEIDSKCENEFVKMSASESNETETSDIGYIYWLGGSDIESEGTWIWASSLTQFTFTDWVVGEPSNWDGENCVRMSFKLDFKWLDTSCSNTFRFICEKRSTN